MIHVTMQCELLHDTMNTKIVLKSCNVSHSQAKG